MATSGSSNITYTAAQIVTAAYNRRGWRVTDTAETYGTTAATIAAAALQMGAGNASPSSAQTTAATAHVTRIGNLWAQYGTILSGGSYANRWAQALIYQSALAVAMDYGRSENLANLGVLAKDALTEARLFTAPFTGLNELNLLCKSWGGSGLYGWLRKTTSWTLTAGTASYLLAESGGAVAVAPPLDILRAYYRNAVGDDITLHLYDWGEWHGIPDKDATGDPIGIFYDRARDANLVYVWPVPTISTHTIYIIGRRPIEDFDAVSNDADFPQVWFEALTTNLALRLPAPPGEEAISPDLLREAAASFAFAAGASRELPKNRPLFGWPNEERGW